MAEPSLLPCPGRGFLMHGEGQYGSYDICPFCNWDDCAFQLANPHDRGGPNGMSLVEHQVIGLSRYPFGIRTAEAFGRTFDRDANWRPLSIEETAFYERTAECFPAVRELKDCNWIRSPLKGPAEAG